MAIYERFDVAHDAEDDDDLPAPVMQPVNARVMEIAHVAAFLAEKDVNLSAETMTASMLSLESDLMALGRSPLPATCGANRDVRLSRIKSAGAKITRLQFS